MRSALVVVVVVVILLGSSEVVSAQTQTPCYDLSWGFEDGQVGDVWDVTTNPAFHPTVRGSGYNSSYALYVIGPGNGTDSKITVAGNNYPNYELEPYTGEQYMETDNLAFSGFISNTVPVTLTIDSLNNANDDILVLQPGDWRSFAMTGTPGRVLAYIQTNPIYYGTVALDDLRLYWCDPNVYGTPTPSPIPSITPTPWATLYPTPSPVPTFTPVTNWLPNLADGQGIIPPLPTPIDIPVITYTLAITQFWNIDNLAIIISTARTIPILANQNHLLDLLFVTAAVLLSIYFISRVSFSKKADV